MLGSYQAQQSTAELSSIQKIKLTVDFNKIHREIVKFVAGKSVSFWALEDDGFKAITEDLFDAVGMISIQWNINKDYQMRFNSLSSSLTLLSLNASLVFTNEILLNASYTENKDSCGKPALLYLPHTTHLPLILLIELIFINLYFRLHLQKLSQYDIWRLNNFIKLVICHYFTISFHSWSGHSNIKLAMWKNGILKD